MTQNALSSIAAGGGASPTTNPPGRSRRRSLALQGVLAIALLSAVLLAGVLLVVGTYGRQLVSRESGRRIEETGNRSVAILLTRVREISALTRSLATLSEQLPTDEAVVQSTLPPLIDFQGDTAVAGGGFWPEPNLFTPGVERRSFFWGRDPDQRLQYFEDYNDPLGPGYHNEEWYVPLRHRPAGAVFWSKSYQDPYSYQPMVTCTANAFRGGQLLGTTTIDLKLERLTELVTGELPDLGGYTFLVDRNNKFLTFPRPEMARKVSLDDRGNRTEEFLYAQELAAKEVQFQPLAAALAAMDEEILRLAQASPQFDASLAARLDQESYAIDAQEASRIAAAFADPLAEVRLRTKTSLVSTAPLPTDPITGQAATAYLFNVPETYWKLVLVVPDARIGAVAAQIANRLLLLSAATILPTLLIAFVVLSRRLLRPVSRLASAAQAVRDGDLDVQVPVATRDEIGELASSFNQMVGRLRTNTRELEVSNSQLRQNLAMTDTIMSTVHEGLFLLDPELRIEAKYSDALRRIFDEPQLAGAQFLDLIRRLTPEKTHELTDRFLRLLFNPAKNDSVIAKINPLKEVEASFPDTTGQLAQKFLSFSFDRIWEGGEIRHAMVTVEDVTQQALLARQLQESERRIERQTELLLSILHVEPQMLRDFVEGAQAELERVSNLLRQQQGGETLVGDRQSVYRQLVDEIYQAIHTLKGSAAMLRIDYFAQAAQRLEGKLQPLRGRTVLEGGDFLPVVLELSELIDAFAEVRQVINRFGAVHLGSAVAATPAVPATDRAALTEVVERFVRDLATKYGKQAEVTFQLAEPFQWPERYRQPLQDVLAQWVRNALTHGLESPAERQAAGKPERGQLLVASRELDGNLELLLRDDGRGLDYQRLVDRVRTLSASDPALLERLVDRETNRWRVAELTDMVFQPGFSTAAESNEDAGRGMGLAAVRDLVQRLGGRVTLRHKPGAFCELHIVLPAT